MGDRGQVKINGVYLYTHFGASELIKDVQIALAKRWRWNDLEYLARIIFDEMKGDDFITETGYGIGTKLHGDVWRLIEVNKNEIIVWDISYTKKLKKKRIQEFKGTFEEFLEWKPKDE